MQSSQGTTLVPVKQEMIPVGIPSLSLSAATTQNPIGQTNPELSNQQAGHGHMTSRVDSRSGPHEVEHLFELPQTGTCLSSRISPLNDNNLLLLTYPAAANNNNPIRAKASKSDNFVTSSFGGVQVTQDPKLVRSGLKLDADYVTSHVMKNIAPSSGIGGLSSGALLSSRKVIYVVSKEDQ